MAIDNIYDKGIASGWNVINASKLTDNRTLEADVAIIGTGAGGGTTAQILSDAGLNVLMIEAGPLQTSDDFKDMDEYRGYGQLYQEATGRATEDGAIAILQGRSVGGSTTVNWTTSLRTPEQTLNHWRDHHNVTGLSSAELQPWFERTEKRQSITPWQVPPNKNNEILKTGCEKLGWSHAAMPRNVKGCWNLGYCGYGCPTNAKQGMLVTTIPAALSNGASLLYHAKVNTIDWQDDQVSGLTVHALQQDSRTPSGKVVTIKAKHYVLAGGAINNPALLLRSETPDPHERVGKRTTVHPVSYSNAIMPEKVDGYHGAPQSIYSDHFLFPEATAGGKIGYKLEVPPLQPTMIASTFASHGEALQKRMAQLPNLQGTLALLRDGFREDNPGGDVTISSDGSPVFNYDFSDAVWDACKRSLLSMAELQFAAGAKRVIPSHLDAQLYTSWQEAKQEIANLPYQKVRMSIFTAHLMGGCVMSEDATHGVVNSLGRHHHLANLSVFDGSIFPTSLGVNPQLSIYGIVDKFASALADELAPKQQAAA